MKLRNMPCALLMLIAVAGCSINRPDDLGTQVGIVTEIMPAQAEPDVNTSCRVEMTPEKRAAGRYVELQFHTYRLVRYTYAFVPTTMELKKGDKVVVKHPYCVGSHSPEIVGFSAK